MYEADGKMLSGEIIYDDAPLYGTYMDENYCRGRMKELFGTYGISVGDSAAVYIYDGSFDDFLTPGQSSEELMGLRMQSEVPGDDWERLVFYFNSTGHALLSELTGTETDWNDARAVHDWMCLNIAYDHDSYASGTVSEGSSGVYGAMKNGLAVCGGYAETFKAFMDALGIECESVEGLANGGFHAWNRVKVNGKNYYIDVTWDDPDDPGEPEFIRYVCYLSEDPGFGGNHQMFTDPMDYYRYIEGWDI